ncbi:MAG: hypothetical protein ACYC6G_09795 [Desulfobaccales bacterium]
MDNTTEKIIIGIFSGIVGFALPYAIKLFEVFIKSKRIKSALFAEFRYAKKEIDLKLKWLGRDVSNYVNQVDEKRIIDYEMKKLFLGEKEEFKLKCTYWEEKYCEVVEILAESKFSYFAEMHRLILEFVEKFAQMKGAFETTFGDPKEMAKACFEDLFRINRELEKKLTMKLLG